MWCLLLSSLLSYPALQLCLLCNIRLLKVPRLFKLLSNFFLIDFLASSFCVFQDLLVIYSTKALRIFGSLLFVIFLQDFYFSHTGCIITSENKILPLSKQCLKLSLYKGLMPYHEIQEKKIPDIKVAQCTSPKHPVSKFILKTTTTKKSSIALPPCNLFIFFPQCYCFKFQLLMFSDSEYQMFLTLLQFYGCAFLIQAPQW